MTSVLAQNLSSPGQGKEHPALFLPWAMAGQSLGGQVEAWQSGAG